MPDRHESDAIMKRVEALVLMATLNAQNHGGDTATAAADLMCAFVLISMRSGANPDRTIEIMKPNAIAACTDFWGAKGRKFDA